MPVASRPTRASRNPCATEDIQRDEACRLAYVALTRARKLCIWMREPADGGAMQSIPERHPSCRRRDVELVLDEIRRNAGVISNSPTPGELGRLPHSIPLGLLLWSWWDGVDATQEL